MDNGHGAQAPMAQLQVRGLGRIIQLDAEKQRWEVHVHIEGRVPGGPENILAKVTIESYEGGPDMLKLALVVASPLIHDLITAKTTRIAPATFVPNLPKGA